MINRITFPLLGLDLEISRGINLFGTGFYIYWYAIIILTGIILGYLYALYQGKKQGIPKDTFSDILLIGLPSAIICARGYFVLSKWDYYSKNIGEIFNLRAGGIAIYGAVIGAVFSVYIYCRIKKINTLKIFDIGAVCLLIGQTVGRWGNFINGEAYGSLKSVDFLGKVIETPFFSGNYILKMGIEKSGEMLYYHPTFLYESVWNLLGVILLHFVLKNKKTDGLVFFLYIFWYGLGRFFIEGLRTDSLMAGSIRISQLIALLSVITGLAVSVYLIFKKKSRE